MDSEVEACPISHTNRLDPAMGCQNLRIPAVACVVRHFVGVVLAEAQAGLGHADLPQEQRHTRHEVAQGLVVHHALVHGLTDGHQNLGVRGILRLPGVEVHCSVAHRVELGVVLVVRRAKVLDLCEGELAHTQQARTGRDLVAECLPHLGGCKGHAPAVLLQQAGEVHKDPLRSFGAEVAHNIPCGADGCLEHQVEGQGGCDGVACVGGSHSVAFEGGIKLFRRHGIGLSLVRDHLMPLLLCQLGVFQQFFNGTFQKMVSTVAVSSHNIANHEV
mmetsp:Transcript_13391/g.34148  ORF Transcript_13391/g.34148 Transcript_13391/m.34148 type:complete len:274 (+) Transcript_13391:816-1637(+)